MKKQLLFLMLLAGSLMAFTGCKKDDDNDSIEGRWKAKVNIEKYFENGAYQTDEDTFAPGEYEITFNGGKFVGYYFGEADDEGTYSISGDKLTLNYEGGGKDEYVIKALNSNTLVLYEEYKYTEGGVTITESDEITFTR